jgi:DNA-binding transcriptional LysR family regulator
MELRQLKTFRTVATLNSFNEAAKVLNYAQSTISEQIRALEEDLNVRLFERSGKKIVLTSAGEILVDCAQKILDLEEEIKAVVTQQKEPRGSLSVRIPETVSIYYLPPVLKLFHERFPKIQFNLMNCGYYRLEQELQSGMIHLAFLIMDHYQAKVLEVESLLSIPLVLVCHPSNSLAGKQQIRVQDLKKESIFLPNEDCSYRMIFERILNSEKVEPAVIVNCNSIEAIKAYIMAGTGITVIPEVAIKKEISRGELTVLNWAGDPLEAKIFMIRHKEKWISPILKTFMEAIRENIRPV